MAALQPVTDVGGTLAFQKAGPGGADEIQIGTSLPHSEVDFFLNDGDPEPVYRNLISQTDWGSIADEDRLIFSFGIAPKVTMSSDTSTWTTEGANGGGDPNQSADVAMFTQKSGVWRMDHGACSMNVSKADILTAAASFFKNQGAFAFDVNMHKFEGVSYVSHPTASAPWADNSGGIIVNASGTADSASLSTVLSGTIATLVLAFTSNPLFALIGLEVQVRSVDFQLTVADRIDVNGQGLLTATAAHEISAVQNDGDCGFNLLNVFSGLVGICVSGQVQSMVDSTAKNTSAINSALQAAFTVPIPTTLASLGTGSDTCPKFQTCSAASDCVVGAKSIGTTLSGIFDGSGTFGLVKVPKANIGISASVPGFITNLSPSGDRTVPGLNADGSGSQSDVWPQAQAQLTNAKNWTCGAIPTTPAGGLPSGLSQFFPKDCPLPTGNVCEYNLRAKRANHYADDMEIVWYDEADKVFVNSQDLPSVAVGSLVSLLGSAMPPCSVTTQQFTDVLRLSPDVIKTSGF